MDPGVELWLRAAGSGLFAGFVSLGVTVAVEKFGGRIGGLLGTLPSTIVPFSVGIYFSAPTVEEYQSSLFAVSPGMLLNSFLLLIWRVFPRYLPARWSLTLRLCLMVVLYLGGWAIGAVLVVQGLDALGGLSPSDAILPVLTTSLGCSALSILIGAVACVYNPPAPGGKKSVRWFVYLARGLLAFTSICVSVYLSAYGSDILASMAGVFPSIFLTTMVSLWISQGEAVPCGAVGPMMLGSSVVGIYASILAFVTAPVGFAGGAVLAWFAAVMLITVPNLLLVVHLQRRQQRRQQSTYGQLEDDSTQSPVAPSDGTTQHSEELSLVQDTQSVFQTHRPTP